MIYSKISNPMKCRIELKSAIKPYDHMDDSFINTKIIAECHEWLAWICQLTLFLIVCIWWNCLAAAIASLISTNRLMNLITIRDMDDKNVKLIYEIRIASQQNLKILIYFGHSIFWKQFSPKFSTLNLFSHVQTGFGPKRINWHLKNSLFLRLRRFSILFCLYRICITQELLYP